MSTKKFVSTVVVVNKNDEILILKRSKTSTHPGTWNFPGGSMESGENAKESAVRELVEETGLSSFSNDLNYLGTLENKYLMIYFYITYKFEGSIQINKESEEFKWVSLDELPQYKFVGNKKIDSNILNKIIKFMEAQ